MHKESNSSLRFKIENQFDLFNLDSRDLNLLTEKFQYEKELKILNQKQIREKKKLELFKEEDKELKFERRLQRIREKQIMKEDRKEFEIALSQVSEFLSWGKSEVKFTYKETIDGEADNWSVISENFFERFSSSKKDRDNLKVSFRLWLFEDLYGRFEASDLKYPGIQRNCLNEFVTQYKDLLSEVLNLFEGLGDVRREKNIFYLYVKNVDVEIFPWELESEVWHRLVDVLSS